MPFRYPEDPEERRKEMRREDRFIAIMTVLGGVGVVMAICGILGV